jgi:hypothetical protein
MPHRRPLTARCAACAVSHPLRCTTAPINDLRIVPFDFADGQAICEIDFTPVTRDVDGNPLAVEGYRLYASPFDGLDFSSPVVEDLPAHFNDGNGLLYFHHVGWTTSGFLYLTAVDGDGTVVAASPGLPAGWDGLRPLADPSAPRLASETAPERPAPRRYRSIDPARPRPPAAPAPGAAPLRGGGSAAAGGRPVDGPEGRDCRREQWALQRSRMIDETRLV